MLYQISRLLDEFRTIPRLLMLFYMWLLYRTSEWFYALPDPSAAQSAFAASVVGAGAAWFGLYLSGRREERPSIK